MNFKAMSHAFLNEHFLLSGPTAERLFYEFARDLPVIDYHCHLPPQPIARNSRFENLTQAWLYGDHYKWRAMRTHGVDERFCTGDASDWEKFEQWAGTVPYTLRNPLYHWTHLELLRYFGVEELLGPTTARRIYERTSEMLRSEEYSVRKLLCKMKVEILCTTDDPVDSLGYHDELKKEGGCVRMYPAFRPDNAMHVSDPGRFNAYVRKLESVTDIAISSFDDFLFALQNRHDYFAAKGCCLSDHGLEEIYADPFTGSEIDAIFGKIRSGKSISEAEQRKFKSAMLTHFAEWDWEKGWVQQYHLGALRNNNARMMRLLGPDTGWDSIGDFPQARNLASFLDRLDRDNRLARTILYNLNPSDNELMATMAGNFNDGSVAGKIQFGSAWWFLDQKEGITRQINALSNMGLLSHFVGMLTDSRSFLSFPRHEYFRRTLCSIFGEEVDRGELPGDIPWIGKIIQDICYNNAKQYFNWT
jgi:glucuronate isomerase